MTPWYFVKIAIFFSFSFTYSLVQWSTYVIQNFWSLYLWYHWCYKRRISNTSSLAIKISSEIALKLQLTSESCYKQTFSKFESIACTFQGTIFDILLNILKRFTWSWPAVWLGSGEVSCIQHLWWLMNPLKFNYCLCLSWGPRKS